MKITLVVPVYNEAEAIPIFYHAVRRNHILQNHEVEIVFINDGSEDSTPEVAGNLVSFDPDVVLINLSRNFGKEPALFAGIEHANGEVIVPIDVDLQDPVDVIPLMLEKHMAGADMVLAKRIDRSNDGFLKRVTAKFFYVVHNKVSTPRIEENVGDFRLMSRKVIDAIKKMPERQLFMKGVLSWVGFETKVVEYVRNERVAGDTKFNGWKLWNLAIEGFTSFSTAPLRVWTYLGGVISLTAFAYAFFIMFNKLFFGNVVSGYASIMTVLLFLGGVQLIGIGVIGEYLGRVYMESKRRPRYIVSKVVSNKKNK